MAIMTTHSLRDLKPQNFVFGARPGNFPVYEPQLWSSAEAEITGARIANLYIRTIEVNENKVKATLMGIYGVPVPVKGRTTELLLKLKQIMQQTGKNITQLSLEIRNYLGYKCSFVTLKGQPIELERIERAHTAISERKSVIEVENLLYL